MLIGCDPTLRTLVQRSFGSVSVIDWNKPLPHYDCHCPILSLPAAFGTTLETIPVSVPYLHADPLETERWRTSMANDDANLRVGLVWAGRAGHPNDRNRSISLSTLLPLAGVEGVAFYSLQKGDASSQIQTAGSFFDIFDRTSELTDFSSTAALIASLDLVISVDTSIVHLAGAMAKPVWTLLPFVADWRWMIGRPDSRWYPTMRLFRQPTTGDWGSVIREVKTQLSSYVLDRKSGKLQS